MVITDPQAYAGSSLLGFRPPGTARYMCVNPLENTCQPENVVWPLRILKIGFKTPIKKRPNAFNTVE